ncbi:MAG: TolC family protein [Hyphomicrobiaceae bacterium]|nr:TolC family protein [Hyphomicrobiaceae bacterium]
MVRRIIIVIVPGFCLAIAGCVVAPDPLTDAELALAADANRAEVTANQEPVTGPIDLYEAMARALKYNLDHRVEEAEAAVRVAELNVSRYDMLPGAVSNSGYASRNNYNAASSFNLTTDTQNFGASTSQDKGIANADIGFSWNILDFGLSYVRARQAADKVLVQDETRRKVMQRVVEDVRTAYWRAISAERLSERLLSLEGETRAALRETRELYDERRTSPITALTYERELIEIKQKIGEIQRELNTAKAQLGALMNLRPGTEFTLARYRSKRESLALKANLDDMIVTALYNRPELREVEYRKRININEADAALLELLPGLQAYAGSNYDSNSFLLNADWVNWGAKASWNLLKVFNYPARRSVVELGDEMLHQRALALSMAVMTQVYVSRIRFFHARKELAIAAEFCDVQKRLLAQIRAEASADRVSKQTLIREEMNTLVAEAKYDIAYAQLQNAYANLFSSMGLDPYGWEIDRGEPVRDLRASLRQLWFERGDLNAGWSKRVASAQ